MGILYLYHLQSPGKPSSFGVTSQVSKSKRISWSPSPPPALDPPRPAIRKRITKNWTTITKNKRPSTEVSTTFRTSFWGPGPDFPF